ncbi:MAG: hypothetical protein K1X78_03920 [Verrucomicrobiaceae bacterium]|nr:hypothetical protein [Verrucomicrobiaceae bacterium]
MSDSETKRGAGVNFVEAALWCVIDKSVRMNIIVGHVEQAAAAVGKVFQQNQDAPGGGSAAAHAADAAGRAGLDHAP